MSVTSTRGIRVEVQAIYLPERSAPEREHYFFAYRVKIANESADTVQLVTRHWVITDAEGHEQEVRGPGVVGETPLLGPGQKFSYTSACPLRTPVGTMHGSYQMVFPGDTDRAGFDAEIAPFRLAVPGMLH